MDSCTEQMLELEQPDELYRLGRALRTAFQPQRDEDGEALATPPSAGAVTPSGKVPQ